MDKKSKEMSEEQVPDSSVSSINYSRWMTDMAEIEQLKIYQLALPCAHNSGVDKAGVWEPISEKFGANQDNSFSRQLAAGARHLDLRLVDSSYKKTVGNHYPTYRFIEVFEFKHGIVSAGRRLANLISDVKSFVERNPLEIVILDFHSYDRGRNYSHTSLERCFPYFTPIKDILIPHSASNLAIGEIRKTYPGCGVVLSFDYGAPKSWRPEWVQRDQLWGSIFHAANLDDMGEKGIEALVVKSMANPPLKSMWALSASVYNNGPKHLRSDHPIRTQTFKAGFQNAKSVSVDFIERRETQVSVVDKCIALNRLRAEDRTKPSAPTNLEVKQLEVSDGKQNTVSFKWGAATDNLGVIKYQIFQNGVFFYEVAGLEFLVKDLHRKNVSFTVCAVDIMGNISAHSNVSELIQDTEPPSLPKNLHFTKIGYPSVEVSWGASDDWAGIAGYEVKVNGVISGSTQELFYPIGSLQVDAEYTIEVRARDINNLCSEWVRIVRPALPKKLVNPVIDLTSSELDPSWVRAVVTWDPWMGYNDSLPRLFWRFDDGSADYDIPHEDGVSPTFSRYMKADEKVTVRAGFSFKATSELSETVAVDIDADLTPPQPVQDLKIVSQSPNGLDISWVKSADPNIVSYAISVNEEPPIFLPASINTYVVEQFSTGEIVIDVWAVDKKGASSFVESIKAHAGPGKPADLEVTEITPTSAMLSWSAPSGTGIRYWIVVNGIRVGEADETHFSLKSLRDFTEYRIEVLAFSEFGVSKPANATFITLLSPPKNLNFSHLSGVCWLTWDAVFKRRPAHEVSINGQVLNIDPGHRIYNFRLSDVSPGPVPHPLEFKVRALLDGAVSEESKLNVTLFDDVPPDKPDAPVVSEITDNSVRFDWKPANDNVGVDRYRIAVNFIYAKTTSDTHITFNNLKSGTAYFAWVRAIDKEGNVSINSDLVFFKTTGPSRKLPPPSPGVEITDSTYNSITLRWHERTGGAEQAVTNGVRVMVNGEYHRDYVVPWYNIYLNDLTLDSTYTIDVQAFDINAQLSEANTIVYVPKDDTPPSVPGNLHCTASTPDSITLEWEKATDDVEVNGYVLLKDDVYFDKTSLLSYTAVGLMPGSHQFEVFAMDTSGNISEAVSVVVNNGPGPGAPTNFRYTRTGLITKLEWDPPSEPVRKYTILLTGPQGVVLPYSSNESSIMPVLLLLTRYQVKITAHNDAGSSSPLIDEFVAS